MSRLRSNQIEALDDLAEKPALSRPRRGFEIHESGGPRKVLGRERGWPDRDASDRRSRRGRSISKREPIEG